MNDENPAKENGEYNLPYDQDQKVIEALISKTHDCCEEYKRVLEATNPNNFLDTDTYAGILRAMSELVTATASMTAYRLRKSIINVVIPTPMLPPYR